MNILHVEDQSIFSRLVQEELSDVNELDDFAIVNVNELAQALKLVRDSDSLFDVILLDLSLPDSQGVSAVEKLRKIDAHIPIVVLSGSGEREVGMEAIKKGAQEYVMKDVFSGELLYKALLYAIERKRIEHEMLVSAMTDLLTGLPNRTYFQEHLEASLERVKRSGLNLFLFFIDFDGFKLLNDTYGHGEGDCFLKEVGSRFKRVIRKSDFCSRIGGDEFAVLIESDHDQTQSVIPFLNKLLAEMRKPYMTNSGDQIANFCSIGVAHFDPTASEEKTMAALMQEADEAMYRAKSDGGDCYRAHDNVLFMESKISASLSMQLRMALKKQQFFLEYQPIYTTEGTMLAGVECLLRWKNDQNNIIPPADFITCLERCQMISTVGRWVIETAVDEYLACMDSGTLSESTTLAVNVAPVQLLEENFLDFIAQQLNKRKTKRSWLVLEITERSFGGQYSSLAPVITDLHELNVQVAIDDFGIGQSNLICLLKLPVDIIKIDKSFVNKIATSHVNAKVTQALIVLAKSLGKRVIAEGVEDKTTARKVEDLGADYLQGFLLGRPQSLSRINSALAVISRY